MHLELILPVNGRGCRVPARQRCRHPRKRSSVNVFAVPAGRCSTSAPTVIGGRSTVVTPAANQHGGRNCARPIAAINRPGLADWPTAAGSMSTVDVTPARVTTAKHRRWRLWRRMKIK